MYDYVAIVAGILGGIVYALFGYFENRKAGEVFLLPDFLAMGLFGGLVGAIMGFAGIAVTSVTFATQSVVYGYFAILIKKGVYALFGKGEPTEGVGVFLRPGKDGWTIQINTSKYVKSLPVDKRYQAVSPGGKVWSGDKEMIEYLADSDDAAAKAWRDRYK